MLSARDRQQLGEAFGLLRGGQGDRAMAIAREVGLRAPAAAEPLHMLALCHRSLGRDAEALAAFEAALARAPQDPDLLGNYANHLRRLGRAAESIAHYQSALRIAPGSVEARINLALAQSDVGDLASARGNFELALRSQPASARGWQGLGSVLRSQGDLAGAESAQRRAVALEPANGAAWINLAVLRRLQGDPADALGCLEHASRAGHAGSELHDARASALLDLGDVAGALSGARALVAAAPGYVPGQVMLAQLLWEHGESVAPGEDARAQLRAAVAAQPANRPLRREYIRFLLQGAAAAEALAQVRELQQGGDEPDLLVQEAQALEMLGDTAGAAALFDRAYPVLRHQAGFLTLLSRHLLGRGDAAASAERSLEALAIEPHNQIALACLGVAWRLASDAREHWLCGYDTLVREVQVQPPADQQDAAAWLEGLATLLTGLHTARREPVDQSLRGGTQTSGNLFGRPDPLLVATRDAMALAVRRYVDELPEDATHPFLRRRSAGVRFAGSWSVRLRSSGRHINHYHQQGWISSAFYVSLPPSVRDAGDGPAGFLQFGEPPAELRTGLGPRRIIRPRVGHLVLFPSYLWHGTLPFSDTEPRLTMAFDVLPA